MAARLGLDDRVWQLCQGVNKKHEKTTYFHNVITNKSFYTLPPDEFDRTYSDEELQRSVPKEHTERVFSLLKNFWSAQQTCALSDAIKASLFLAYNKREL